MEPFIPPAHLPRRLAISFPIWALFDMAPGGAYHDPDRWIRETAERGFNCIRFDDGAGLIDFSGPVPNGKVRVRAPFGPTYSAPMRQLWVMGDEGECDLVERLLAIAEAADRHGVYLILSSWYYLHTNWYFDNPAKNREYFELSDPERFAFFARQLDSILGLLRSHKLIHRVAFAEIQNEIDGAWNFFGSLDGRPSPLAPGQQDAFREAHAKALAWLRARHPDVLFAVDTCTPWTPAGLFPPNLQVWNFHSYFMWDHYGLFERRLMDSSVDVDDPAELGETAGYLLPPERRIPLDAILATREGLIPAMGGWNNRIWLYNNIDPAKIGALNRRLSDELDKKAGFYRKKIVEMLDAAAAFRDARCPGVPLVLGEGVTYESLHALDWEEESDTYWDIVEFAVREYRRRGLWGAVIRTCSSCEDVCWDRCADRLRRLNGILLAD